MRFSMKFLAVLVLFMTSAAFAQNGVFAPYVNAGVSTTAAAGYKNPDFTVGAGIESNTRGLLMDVHGTFDTANSIKTNNGYTGGLNASVYVKVLGPFLIGGGANWAVNTAQLKTQFSNIDATRQSAHPFIGGGFQAGKFRLLADYNLPGKEALTNERIVDVNAEFFAAKHVRITANATVNSFIDITSPSKSRATANKLGVGIKLVI